MATSATFNVLLRFVLFYLNACIFVMMNYLIVLFLCVKFEWHDPMGRFSFYFIMNNRVLLYLYTWRNLQLGWWKHVCLQAECLLLTLSLPWCHLKNDQLKVKFQILKHFCFLFRTTREKFGIKMHRTESWFVIGPGKYTVCRRVRAFFSPDFCLFTGLVIERVKDFDFKWVPSYNRHSQGGRVV